RHAVAGEAGEAACREVELAELGWLVDRLDRCPLCRAGARRAGAGRGTRRGLSDALRQEGAVAGRLLQGTQVRRSAGSRREGSGKRAASRGSAVRQAVERHAAAAAAATAPGAAEGVVLHRNLNGGRRRA